MIGISVARASRRNQEDHRRHDQDRKAQGQLDLMDRAFDENGRVGCHEHLHICRQDRLQIVHHLPHRRRDLQRIAIGLPDDAQPDPRLAIGAQDRRRARDPVLRAPHRAASPRGPRSARRSARRCRGPPWCGPANSAGQNSGRRPAHQRPPPPVRRRSASVNPRAASCSVHIHAENQTAVAENLQIGNAGRR